MRWNNSFRGTDSIYGESIYTKRWELIGNYQLPVEEKVFFSFSATAHKQNSFYGTTPYMGDQRIGFGQLLWNKEIGARHALLTGFAGRYNYYDDNSTATIDIQKGENRPEQYFIPGLFVQDEWEINSKHKLLTGLRVDHHPAHKFIVTPRVAYKWKLDEKQDFRLNAGTGFRVVNLFTEDHAALTGARVVEVREQLKPEQSYNINSNYTLRLGDRSRPFIIDASAWYTFFHNQIIPDYDTDPQKIIYDNLNGHAVSKGVSINLEWNWLQKLKSNVGVTFQDVATYEEAEGKSIKTRPVLTERFSGTWALSYSFHLAGLTIDYTGNVYGPMRLPLLSETDPRKSDSPWWTIQNIQFTKWISGKAEVFAGVKNIFNWTPAKNNPFLIARSHDPFNKNVQFNADGTVIPTAENPYGLTFDPSYVYAPNQGIRLFAGIKYKIK
jgi:outer membrane receptor for ferrienterochelin and colicins